MSGVTRRLLPFALLVIASSTISACAVKTIYTLVGVGKPGQILNDTTVDFRQLNSDGQHVRQNVGGWIAMPPDHWEIVKEALEELERLRKEVSR